MNRWHRWLENPVFVKEMRVGFREKKVFFALTAWVIIVALFASISAAVALAETNAIAELPEAGKVLFEMLFWVQLVLLAMLAPSLTTSAVSGERERQSFEMLLTTQLKPSELIFGKFGFAGSFIVLALFSTIPLEAIVFFLGGVSLPSFLYSKLILLLFGALCSLLGLMHSARESRSAHATGQTYLILIVIFIPSSTLFSVLRYTDDAPFAAYLLCVTIAVYLTLFLFWKAVNHLEERASHLKWLLSIDLVFYLLLMGICLSSEQLWQSLDESIWLVFAPLHYFLMGIMLNPMRPERAQERMIFAQSPLSEPLYWGILLCAGALLPNIYAVDFEFTAMSIYTVLAGMGTALFARGLCISQPKRFPYVLGFSWLLLNVIPGFAAITGVGDADSAFHPALISPFYYLVSSFDHGLSDAPLLAYGFYTILGVLGLILCLKSGPQKAHLDVSVTTPIEIPQA